MDFNVITPVKLGQGAILTSPSIFHTTPANTRTLVKNIDVCNTTTADINVTVYLVPSGDSPSSSNALFSNLRVRGTVVQGGLIQWSGIQIMNAGDTIQAVAVSTGLTINISGGEAV